VRHEIHIKIDFYAGHDERSCQLMCLVEVLVLANYLHLMGPRSALIKRNIRSVHKQLSLPSVFLGQFKMQKDGEKQAKRTFSACVGFVGT